MWKDKEKLRKYHRDRLQRRYYGWKAVGGCIKCGKPCAPYVQCFEHRLKAAQNSKKQYEKSKSKETK